MEVGVYPVPRVQLERVVWEVAAQASRGTLPAAQRMMVWLARAAAVAAAGLPKGKQPITPYLELVDQALL